MTARRLLRYLPVIASLSACSAQPPATAPLPDPGYVTLRRLTRTEYNNTARDLLGSVQRPADRFPDDDVAQGFDNNGDVLSVSSLHVDMWQRAAEALVNEVLRPDGAPVQKQLGTDQLRWISGVTMRGDDLVLSSTAAVSATFDLPMDGTYNVMIRAYEDHVGTDVTQMGLTIDGRAPEVVSVAATGAMPQVYTLATPMFAGSHILSISLENVLHDPGSGQDRHLVVSWARIEGPAGKEMPNPQVAKVLSCSPADSSLAAAQACARQILGRFARLAWRRPPASDELDRLLTLFQVGLDEEQDFVAGINVALQGVLMSPHFLYRVELDPDPSTTTAHPLSDFELATRLAYFLWSSTPDDELLQQAEQGALSQPEGIAAQVTRLLADPRATALVDNFAAQWLGLRALDSAEPDITAYPGYSATLRTAMGEETRRFVSEFFPQPGNATPTVGLQALPDAPFTFVNPELAQYYGLPGPTGTDWLKVPLDGTPRRGLLTQGSVLLMTSYPSRTSPVRRGKWILEQLLCSPPPPPPPNVIGDFGNGPAMGSLRQRLEQHRKNPVCASCHNSLDPLGFALESFDGVGMYRTMDGGTAVDASGTYDGHPFKDATQLAPMLAADPRLGSCAVAKMFTFALGRAPTSDDSNRLADLSGRLAAGAYKAAELVLQIAQSDAFRNRRGDGMTSPAPTAVAAGRAQGGAR